MNDIEIETLIGGVIDAFLQEEGKSNSLSFDVKSPFVATWENNHWRLTHNQADPVSLLVVQGNLEKNTELNDDPIIATVAKFLGRPAWYIYSFQLGWFDKSNSSMSITAYLIGRKLRKAYFK